MSKSIVIHLYATCTKMIGGWGSHGYIGDEIEKVISGPEKHVVSHTGYVIRKDHKGDSIIPSGYFDFAGTINNTKDDLNVLVEGFLMTVDHLGDHLDDTNKLVINITNPDVKKVWSKYLDKWEENGYKVKGKNIPNKDTWERLGKLKKLLSDKNISIRFVNAVGNKLGVGLDKAKVLATTGTQPKYYKDKKGLVLFSETDKYWKYVVKRPSLLSLKHLIIITTEPDDIGHKYYLMNADLDDIGRKCNMCTYGFVKLKKRDPIIDTMRERLKQDAIGCYAMSAKLDVLYGKAIARDIEKYGTGVLLNKPGMLSYHHVNSPKRLVSEAIQPFNMILRGVRYASSLEKVIDKYESGDDPKYVFEDITDCFFEKGRPKKEILKGKITLMPKPRTDRKDTIPYVLGTDVPNISMLRKLGESRAKVYLASWETDEVPLRYGVIFETKDGIGIYCNFLASIIFF